MKQSSGFASLAAAAIAGAVAFNVGAAQATIPVVDWTSIAKEIGIYDAVVSVGNILTTINGVENAISTTMNTLTGNIGTSVNGTVTQLLQQGFTQTANYTKANAAFNESLTDASNTAMAGFHRSLRTAQIRDEHTPSPTACAAVDGGVSTQSAAVQAFQVGQVIAHVHDQRGQAGPGMPSYFGAAQGVAANAAGHANLYCDAVEQAAGLCTLTATPDADQEASSLFGAGTLANQAAVNAAKDYAVELVEPVAPAALRGDQLTSTAGQEAAVQRRSYNARMSLAQSYVDSVIGMEVPSVPLTAVQTQYLQDMGLPAITTGSWLQALQIEAERRETDPTWHATLQGIPPASVEREIALELALNNYLQFQILRQDLQRNTMAASQLAIDTQRGFVPTVQMPSPIMGPSGS